MSRRPFESSLSYRGMARLFYVTKEEAAHLGEWLGPKLTREDKHASRLELMQRELVNLGCWRDRNRWPSTRTMADRLKQQGVSMSHCTVARIYKGLYQNSC
jgi:hypothetical protein